MTKKFTLYLGLNDKDSKVQKISTIEAYKMLTNVLMKNFEGATIFEATGLYKHDDGTFVIEPTLRIELLFAEEHKVRALVDMLKLMFNQESIAVQTQDISSNLW